MSYDTGNYHHEKPSIIVITIAEERKDNNEKDVEGGKKAFKRKVINKKNQIESNDSIIIRSKYQQAKRVEEETP